MQLTAPRKCGPIGGLAQQGQPWELDDKPLSATSGALLPLNRNSTPRTRNSTPAPRFNHSGETKRVSASPPTMAMADVMTSAAAEPANTTQRELPPAERDSVASCVLSPSSAK